MTQARPRSIAPSFRRAASLAICLFMGLGAGPAVQAVPASVPASSVPTVSAVEEKRALAGEILVRMGEGAGDIKDFVVVGTIDAPVSRVYEAFTDYAGYADLYGAITRSEVKGQEAGGTLARLTFGLPWPIGDRWVLARYQADPTRRLVTWQRTEGSMPAFEGAAEFRPISPMKTLMIYQTKVDLGVGFMPPWLFNWLQQQSLPSVVQDVRSHVKR